MAEGKKYTCQKCGKTMDGIQFYTYKDGTKTELCKKCLTMHIDNFDESTFLWVLQKMDVPYIPEEWNVIRDKAFAKDPTKMNGMSVIGKYLSKMKLNQWKDKTWADTEKILAERKAKEKEEIEIQKQYEEELRRQVESGEITESQYKTLTSTFTLHESPPVIITQPPETSGNPFNSPFMSEDELIDPGAELTQDDKLYLAMKWGRLYKPSEWVELERKYTEMMNSFDIQDSDTEGTLILICKTYLKMNQAIKEENRSPLNLVNLIKGVTICG